MNDTRTRNVQLGEPLANAQAHSYYKHTKKIQAHTHTHADTHAFTLLLFSQPHANAHLHIINASCWLPSPISKCTGLMMKWRHLLPSWCKLLGVDDRYCLLSVFMRESMHVCVCTWVCVCVNVCVCVKMNIYACRCRYTYIYIYSFLLVIIIHIFPFSLGRHMLRAGALQTSCPSSHAWSRN